MTIVAEKNRQQQKSKKYIDQWKLEIFYLHFGDSFLLDHRQEELHFKLSLTHV